MKTTSIHFVFCFYSLFFIYMSNKCNTTSSVVWLVRILLGAAMIFFWASKFGMWPEGQAMIWWAAHLVWLTFLSATTWFWIAVIGEVVAWVLLLFWWKTKIWALLTLLIMVFAWNFTGWDLNINAIAVSLAAIIVLVWGPGKWACDKKCCGGCTPEGKDCCGSKTWPWCCGSKGHQHQQQ